EPIAGVRPDFPIARVIDANVYVRHERGGLMLGGYEADPLQLDAATLPADIAELPLDIEVLWRLARSVAEQFPIFQDPSIRLAAPMWPKQWKRAMPLSSAARGRPEKTFTSISARAPKPP